MQRTSKTVVLRINLELQVLPHFVKTKTGSPLVQTDPQRKSVNVIGGSERIRLLGQALISLHVRETISEVWIASDRRSSRAS